MPPYHVRLRRTRSTLSRSSYDCNSTRSCERISKKSSAQRIYFLAGRRAAAALATNTAALASVCSQLRVPPADAPAEALRLQSELKEVCAARKRLLKQAALDRAADLVRASEVARKSSGDAAVSQHLHFIVAPSLANTLMGDVVAAMRTAGALGADNKGVVLLTCSSGEVKQRQLQTCVGMFLIAGGDEGVVADVGEAFAASVEGKGGGRKGAFQGKCARVDKAAAAARSLLPGFIDTTTATE